MLVNIHNIYWVLYFLCSSFREVAVGLLFRIRHNFRTSNDVYYEKFYILIEGALNLLLFVHLFCTDSNKLNISEHINQRVTAKVNKKCQRVSMHSWVVRFIEYLYLCCCWVAPQSISIFLVLLYMSWWAKYCSRVFENTNRNTFQENFENRK